MNDHWGSIDGREEEEERRDTLSRRREKEKITSRNRNSSNDGRVLWVVEVEKEK
jgi:hypothetical protein